MTLGKYCLNSLSSANIPVGDIPQLSDCVRMSILA